jgi:hypothetical protein
LRAVLKLGLLVAVIAFVAWTAWDLAERWQHSAPVDVHWGWLSLSLVPIGFVSLAQALGWRSLLQHMVGRELAFVPTVEMLLASMLGRYAPAKVGMPAILLARARELELSRAALASSLLLMVGVYGLLGTGIGVGALMTSGIVLPAALAGLRSSAAVISLSGMAAGVLVLLVLDRRHYPKALLAKLDLQGEGPLCNVAFVVWFSLVWVGWWLHGALVMVAVGGTWAQAVQGAGMFVLAPVIGFLALVSPGGLGVREAVIARGVAPIIGSAPAVAASLIARVASLGMDVAMWLLFRALRRRQRAG